ncbi:MAG: hypothetical protein GW855_11805 [Erythrobacter sp.]|nr:hypothetical protein [Erythrobacter sp.]NCQ63056.1 hypothetical protein [Alphaproteobacteria bacterium]
MSIRGLSSWQTALADLSLILFAVVAAAYREYPEEADPASREQVDQAVEIALGQPMAVFRPGGDADLTRWLGSQPLGNGEVATVIVRHRRGGAAQAASEAAMLVEQIEDAGQTARLMVEPLGPGETIPETLVVIAHDDHGLQNADDGTVLADTQ